MRRIRTVLAFAVLFAACERNRNSIPFEPPFPEAAKQNVDPGLLSEAYSAVQSVPGIKCLLVGRNGIIVAEKYFNGQGPDSLNDVRSVTKSVVSILIGIAIDKGLIRNVDQTIGDYLSPIAGGLDSTKSTIAIRHLLTMTGGFQWPEFGDWSEYSLWSQAPDQIDYILAKPLIHEPGTVFNYNDAASHLLSVILSRASGIPAPDFAERHLFGPLGIPARPWATDNRGYNKGCVALKLAARDMMKLGTLFLRKGTFDGRAVVSPEWVAASVRTSVMTGLSNPYMKEYGCLWWIDRSQHQTFYYANGYGGQFILNVPESNLTVVAACEYRLIPGAEANEHWYRIMSAIVNFIIPAAR